MAPPRQRRAPHPSSNPWFPLISRLKGTLLSRDLSSVEVETSGGVVYEVEVPLTILQRLPPEGSPVELRTYYLVREDSAALFGFMDPGERELFKRLLGASGVGAKLALAMLSTYSAPRLAQALAEKDLAALTQVSGIGKKKAERIALELADKVSDLALDSGAGAGGPPPPEGAVSALITLGYSFAEADAAVRRALSEGENLSTEELVRLALAGN
jgi:Holliday junction DNA helicase RuvA